MGLKWRSQNEAYNYTESYFSQQVWKVSNPWKMFLFDGNNFFVQTSKTRQILPNFFPPQNPPYTAKLSFSGVMKHFREIYSKLLFLVKKIGIS